MNIQMPSYVKLAIDKLGDAGFSAYAVGGCVRDCFLNKEPTDWDITTSAKPEQIAEVFKAERVIPTGLKHGTLTIILEGHHLEITTYRIDGEYSDNRHPEGVTFTDLLSEDLKRRDFTMNTLAYNQGSGLVDEFGGLEDLNNKLIKCVGDPDKRFSEDALRIMRALRFSSVLSFNIDPGTKDSIFRNAHLLNNVSAERISSELLKLLCGKNVAEVLLEYRDVFAIIIPELKPTFDFDQNNKHHIYTVYDHMVHSVAATIPEPDLRLALLLHDIGKPQCYFTDENGVGHFYGHAKISHEIAEPILKRLKLTNEQQKTILELILNHDCIIPPQKKAIKRRLSKFGEPLFLKLLDVKRGDCLAHNLEYKNGLGEIDEVERILKEILADKECFSLKDLQIDGTVLLSLGATPGKAIGEILNTLLSEVMDDTLPNTSDDLQSRAKELIRRT